MCKELALIQVSGPDNKAGKEESNVNFRKLIINRCQSEFEKNTVDENAKALKVKEIEACTDPVSRTIILSLAGGKGRGITIEFIT